MKDAAARAPILAGALPVGELLNSANFLLNVPPYQRPYEWGTGQVRKLLNDIEYLASREQEFHLLGNVVLLQMSLPAMSDHKSLISKEAGRRECDIVDGQQRCTTLVILYAAIHSHLYQKAAAAEEEQVKAELTKLAKMIEKALLTLTTRQENLEYICMFSGKCPEDLCEKFSFGADQPLKMTVKSEQGISR
jgi:hypothetical protein